MSQPLDEDAAALARTAAAAVGALNDATAASVDYPGLAGPRDAEDVLVALATLSDGLQETATHLTRYLVDQLQEDRLAATDGSSQPPSAAVRAAGDALRQVQHAADEMSALLTQAELAMLALTPAHGGRRP